MINTEEEVDADVTWEDQQNINTFGKLNNKLHELQAEYKLKQEEVNNVQDASSELMLADDDMETLKYRIGEVYVSLKKEEVEKRIEEEEERLTQEMDELSTQMEEIKKVLAELKVKLYAKFKNTINLEEE